MLNDILGPLVSISTISAVGHVSTPQNPQKSWPDIQYFLVGLGPVKGVGRAMEQIMNIKGDLFEEYMAPHSGKDANFVLQGIEPLQICLNLCKFWLFISSSSSQELWLH